MSLRNALVANYGNIGGLWGGIATDADASLNTRIDIVKAPLPPTVDIKIPFRGLTESGAVSKWSYLLDVNFNDVTS